MEDSHPLNVISHAAGSSRVKSSNIFLRISLDDLQYSCIFILSYRIQIEMAIL